MKAESADVLDTIIVFCYSVKDHNYHHVTTTIHWIRQYGPEWKASLTFYEMWDFIVQWHF